MRSPRSLVARVVASWLLAGCAAHAPGPTSPTPPAPLRAVEVQRHLDALRETRALHQALAQALLADPPTTEEALRQSRERVRSALRAAPTTAPEVRRLVEGYASVRWNTQDARAADAWLTEQPLEDDARALLAAKGAELADDLRVSRESVDAIDATLSRVHAPPFRPKADAPPEAQRAALVAYLQEAYAHCPGVLVTAQEARVALSLAQPCAVGLGRASGEVEFHITPSSGGARWRVDARGYTLNSTVLDGRLLESTLRPEGLRASRWHLEAGCVAKVQPGSGAATGAGAATTDGACVRTGEGEARLSVCTRPQGPGAVAERVRPVDRYPNPLGDAVEGSVHMMGALVGLLPQLLRASAEAALATGNPELIGYAVLCAPRPQ